LTNGEFLLGNEKAALTVKRLLRAVASSWEAQRIALGFIR